MNKLTMKLIITIVNFLFILTIVSGQKTKKEPNNILFFSPGISYQDELFGELNLMYAKDSRLDGGSCSGPAAVGPRLGIEFNMNPSNPIIVPKIGYEYSGLFLCLRVNALYYISQQQKDFRLLGEIGLSLSGYINLTYGYILPLQESMTSEYNESRVAITINLTKRLSQQFKKS
jgi:hypothetical protein